LNSNYYIPQTPKSKELIQFIWQVDGTPAFKNEIIIPKGNVEVIFNFSGVAVNAQLDDKQVQLTKCFINGFNTSPILVKLPMHHIFFGVQFHPIVIKKLFGTPVNEITNRVVDLTQIDPEFNSLWHQLAHKESFTEKAALICTWAEKKYFDMQPREQLLNSFLVNELQQTISVNELAKNICYSTRQLSRKIYELTGLNTEDILLYKKYLRSVNLMQHTQLPLTEIAYESHFADQSHFIKSFRLFAKLAPGEYRQSKSSVKGHIFEDVR